MGSAAAIRTFEPTDVERLKSGMAALERLRDELQASLNVQGETIAGLEEDVADRNSEIADLKSEIEDLTGALHDAEDRANDIEEHTTALARVRTKIKAGHIDDGLYDLETVLSHLDHCWRLRA